MFAFCWHLVQISSAWKFPVTFGLFESQAKRWICWGTSFTSSRQKRWNWRICYQLNTKAWKSSFSSSSWHGLGGLCQLGSQVKDVAQGKFLGVPVNEQPRVHHSERMASALETVLCWVPVSFLTMALVSSITFFKNSRYLCTNLLLTY